MTPVPPLTAKTGAVPAIETAAAKPISYNLQPQTDDPESTYKTPASETNWKLSQSKAPCAVPAEAVQVPDPTQV